MGEYGVSTACIIGSTELLSFFFLLSTLTTGEHSPSMCVFVCICVFKVKGCRFVGSSPCIIKTQREMESGERRESV